MSIIYALVSRGDIVLAEWTSAQGNFVTVTRELLKRLDPFTNRRTSYSYDDRLHYHILVDSGLIYLCMADATYQKRRAHQFLTDLKQIFITQFGDSWQEAIAFQFNNQFSRTIQARVEYHSDASSDKLTQLKSEIDAAKGVVIENIEKILERGDHIDILVEKTKQMSEESYNYKNKAVTMKRRFWWKNVKLTLIIGGLVALILFLIIWFACGVPAFQNCTALGKITAPSPPPSPPPPPPSSPSSPPPPPSSPSSPPPPPTNPTTSPTEVVAPVVPPV